MARKPAGYWNIKEHCIALARECKTMSEICHKSDRAYYSIKINGWEKECPWLLSEQEARSKNNGNRTDQEEWIAKARSIWGDRYDYSQTVYKGAHEKLTVICPIHGPFEVEARAHLDKRMRGCPECKREILQANFIAECKKVHEGYGDDYSKVKYVNNHTQVCIIVDGKEQWFHPRTYLLWKRRQRCTDWTEESALAVAHSGRYTTWGQFINDLKNGGHNAYEYLRKNNLLDKVKLEKTLHDSVHYVIYVYIDYENKIVYVGLTNGMKRRDRQHRIGCLRKGIRTYDTVWKYFKGNGKEIPDYIIKMEELTADEAAHYEDWYLNAYRANGWTAINIAKAGSLGRGYKWTDEMLIEIASKYDCKSDMMKNDGKAYAAAYKRHMLGDLFPNSIHKSRKAA